MKIFYDTEFLDDGKTIDLISIGMVKENGEELYLINRDMDIDRIFEDEWVRENVLGDIFSDLKTKFFTQNNERDPSECKFRKLDFCYLLKEYGSSKEEMKEEITKFVGNNPIFYAYCASYDWVALCQIWGKMIDIPKGWRYYTRDVRQMIDDQNFDTSNIHNLGEHNALADAKYCMALYNALKN